MVAVEEQPPFGFNSKVRLYGYGFRAVAKTAGVSGKTVLRAVSSGKLRLKSLAAVVEYIKSKL